MGSVGSDGEDERLCNGMRKKIKLPKKMLDDCVQVDHAPVPRKQRSAIKNRICKPSSPPLTNQKRLIHSLKDAESPKKNCLKKAKVVTQDGISDCLQRRAISEPITKDEEEVAEALYALAALIPGNSSPLKNKLDGETSVGKPLESSDEPKVPKEEAEVTCPEVSCEETNLPPATETSLEENVTVGFPTMSVVSKDKSQESGQYSLNVNSSGSQLNHEERPLGNSVFLGVPTELGLDTLTAKHRDAVLPPRNFETVPKVAGRDGQRDVAMECRENGPTFLQGSSSRSYSSSGVDGLPRSSTFPTWLSTAGSCENESSIGKVPVNAKGKSWKRCAAHVYIGRLIQVLQISAGKDAQHLEACQLSKSEVVTASIQQNATKQELRSGIVSAFGGVDSGGEKNLDEAVNCMFRHWRVNRNHKLTPPAPEVHASRKNFGFLSLSCGSGGKQTVNDPNVQRSVLEPLSHCRVPYLQPLQQHSTVVPSPLPQNRHTAGSYWDQIAAARAATPSAQAHLQRPPYFGSGLRPVHVGSATSASQLQQMQTQHQQQIWTAQLAAAYYRPGSHIASHIPNWQNGRQEQRSSMQYIQGVLPSPESSLEKFRTKHLQILQQQQQQQLMAHASSLPPSRTKTPLSQLSSSCEENEGRFLQDGILPLQLLLQ